MCIDPLLYVITGGPVIEGSNQIFVQTIIIRAGLTANIYIIKTQCVSVWLSATIKNLWKIYW